MAWAKGWGVGVGVGGRRGAFFGGRDEAVQASSWGVWVATPSHQGARGSAEPPQPDSVLPWYRPGSPAGCPSAGALPGSRRRASRVIGSARPAVAATDAWTLLRSGSFFRPAGARAACEAGPHRAHATQHLSLNQLQMPALSDPSQRSAVAVQFLSFHTLQAATQNSLAASFTPIMFSESHPWFAQDPAQYDADLAHPAAAFDLAQDWSGWDYNMTPSSTLSEQQVDPASAQTSPFLEPSGPLSPWSAFPLDPKTAWTAATACAPIIEGRVLEPGKLTSEEAQQCFLPGTFSLHSQPHACPSHRSNSSSMSISTSAPSGLIPGSNDSRSFSFSVATAMASEINHQNPPKEHLSPTAELDLPRRRTGRKRKSVSEGQKTGPPKQRSSQVAGHSVCEKRYRTKLNVKLAALRERVPSLRVIPKRSEEYAYREGTEKLERPEASTKFDKATIVSKAIEYILYLEMCNKRLGEEDSALKDRVTAIQEIAMEVPRRAE